MSLRVLLTTLLGVMVFSGIGTTGRAQQSPTPLETDKDKASYGLGADIAKNLQNSGLEINLAAFIEGFRTATAQQPLRVSAEEFRESMTRLQRESAGKLAAKNLQQGQAFLQANAKRPGVQVLPSGLQYEVLKQGNGPSPKATDTVRTHYKGTLIDGTVFDSSYERGEPAVFGVDQVIPGWTEALQRMKVGDKWRLVIPPDLAYGQQGVPPDIGPNSVLVFEVELLGIES